MLKDLVVLLHKKAILYVCVFVYTMVVWQSTRVSVQIMLGLLSHEPHFSLLREEVRFGRKSQKRNTTPSTQTFHLLHLSIMREYLDFEFHELKVSSIATKGEKRTSP